MRWLKVKKGLVIAVVFLSAWLASLRAFAEFAPKYQDGEKYELQTIWGLGVAPGVAAMGSDCTTAPLAVGIAQTVRFPRYSQFGLELNFVAPGGLGANLLIDVVKFWRLRVHLIDPGIVWNLTGPASVTRVKRDFDLTLGAGVDIRLNRELAVTVNWRMYFPDPFSVISRYGDFARPVYAEAAKGGQLWFGLARVW